MGLNNIEWTQACCGESYKWAEVQCPSGWLRIKWLPDDTYLVTSFDSNGVLTSPEREMSESELSLLL